MHASVLDLNKVYNTFRRGFVYLPATLHLYTHVVAHVLLRLRYEHSDNLVKILLEMAVTGVMLETSMSRNPKTNDPAIHVEYTGKSMSDGVKDMQECIVYLLTL